MSKFVALDVNDDFLYDDDDIIVGDSEAQIIERVKKYAEENAETVYIYKRIVTIKIKKVEPEVILERDR